MVDIGFVGALIGGVLSLLSPCSVMLLPAFFAYAFSSHGQLVKKTTIFYLGLISTLVPLGIFAASLGGFIAQYRYALIYGAAAIIILIGILQVIGVNFTWLQSLNQRQVGQAASQKDPASSLSVFFLGAVYAVAGVCTGPILGSVLTMAALGGQAVYGALLLAIYGFGMVLPLYLLALVWDKLGTRGKQILKPKMFHLGNWSNSRVTVISGLLAIGIGLFLILTDGTESFGGIFSIDTQYAAESWVSTQLSQISNYWFVIGAVVVLVLVAGVYWIFRKPEKSVKAEAALPVNQLLEVKNNDDKNSQ